MIKGIGVSSGIGVGKILRIETLSLEYSKKQFTDTKTEKNRFYNAIEVLLEDRCKSYLFSSHKSSS